MKQRWDSVIMGLIAVGMTTVFCYMFFGVERRELDQLRVSVAALERELAAGTDDIAQNSGVQAKLSRANELLTEYQARVPADAEIGSLIEQISSIAGQLNLKEQNVAPLSPRELTSVTALPIRISFTAGFADAFAFLREIEELPRLTRLVELSIERQEDRNPRTNPADDVLHVELIMQVFYKAIEAGANT